MSRWLAAGLLFLGWQFATTFLMPAGSPRSDGRVVWPDGRDSGRSAIMPLVVDAVLLWGVLVRGWRLDGLTVP